MVGSTSSFSLVWQEPEGSRVPQVTLRSPTGASVSPYRTPLRLSISGADPASAPSLTITSAREGVLQRDVIASAEDLAGSCGAALAFSDESLVVWPTSDTIRVTVSGDVESIFGETLSAGAISWQFVTGPADETPPVATVGLLGNTVLTAYVTALVFASEPLYATDDGPVRLLVNGTETVALHAQNDADTDWVASYHVPATGTYSFAVEAADIAGNRISQAADVYAGRSRRRSRCAIGPHVRRRRRAHRAGRSRGRGPGSARACSG